MSASPPFNGGEEHRATVLLRQLAAGEGQASDELYELVHDELHGLAAALMVGERRDHTLQPTALDHEAWLRLLPDGSSVAEGRRHFMRLAARAMRSVLVDHARRRAADKRGGGGREELLVEEPGESRTGIDALEVIAIDEALAGLKERDEELARLVELRFFGGLTADEVADVLGKSRRQVEGSWVFARGWLRRELSRKGDDD